jgi:hypothetical protein
MKLKKFLSYFLAVTISAVVLSISLYASVELRDDAPTTVTVDVTGAWNIDVSTLFDVAKESHTIWYDEYLDPNEFNVTVNETPEGVYGYDSENKNMFSFDPDYADIGKTFSFTFYVKGNGSGLGTAKNHTITVTVTGPQETTPNAAIDFVNTKLTGLVPLGSYTTIAPDGTTLTGPATANGEIITIDGFLGETISIVKNGDYISTGDSEPQELYIPARPSAPSLTGVMASAAGNDGKIIGLDPTKSYTCFYPYGGRFTVSGETEITGLEPESYVFIVSAVEGESFASMETIVTVPGYPATVNNGLVLPTDSGTLWYGNDVYQIPENTPDPILGGGSYNYDSDSSTLTFNDVSFTTSNRNALRLQDGTITLNINGTNLLKSTNTDDGNAVFGADVTITGTGSLTAEHARNAAFGNDLTIAMTDYTYESVDDRIVIITYKAPAPAPEKPQPTPIDTPHYSNTPPPSPPRAYSIDGGTIDLPNNRNINTDIRFNSKRLTQTEAYIAEKFKAAALGSFETAQKGGWGDIATITISLEKLGFDLEDGTKLYVLIFDTKTKEWHQVEAEVIGGNIIIVTEWSGIFAIVNEKVL